MSKAWDDGMTPEHRASIIARRSQPVSVETWRRVNRGESAPMAASDIEKLVRPPMCGDNTILAPFRQPSAIVPGEIVEVAAGSKFYSISGPDESFANRNRMSKGLWCEDAVGYYAPTTVGRHYVERHSAGKKPKWEFPHEYFSLPSRAEYARRVPIDIDALHEEQRKDVIFLDGMSQTIVQEFMYVESEPQKPAGPPPIEDRPITPIFGESSLSDLRKGVMACWDSFRPAGF